MSYFSNYRNLFIYLLTAYFPVNRRQGHIRAFELPQAKKKVVYVKKNIYFWLFKKAENVFFVSEKTHILKLESELFLGCGWYFECTLSGAETKKYMALQ